MMAASAPPAYVVDGVAPGRVERPASAGDVARLVGEAARDGQSVLTWGAGTKQGLGGVPHGYDLALDVTALDQVVEYEPADLVVTVQAGIRLEALQMRLREHGQFLALDPPYAAVATIGGTLATNMSGPSRLLYGTARDLVLGMQVALPNGELVKSGGRVVKNVVGYDLNKMHVGGLGTLGVMTEVTLKVHPLHAAEATVMAVFEGLAQASEAAAHLARSPLYLRAIDLVRAPVLDLDQTRWHVLAWCSGSPATVERQARDAQAACASRGASRVSRLHGDEHRALWDAVREQGRGSGTLAKLTCLPADVAALIEAVDAQTGGAAQVVARAGNGVVYAALPGGAPEAALDSIMKVAIERGGSAVLEEAPVAVKRSVSVWGPVRGDFGLMQALKAQFDPKNTLNPGRFVGGI